jgi:outer membrane protein, multidrug efflux system
MRLAVLLGSNPANSWPSSRRPRRAAAPPEVPIGLPSDLLRRRPDVRRAERQLAAETARIGVAKSDWFPKISLTGDAGGKRQRQQLVRTRQPILVDRPEPAMERARFRPGARAGARANRRAGGGAGDYQKAVLVSLQEAENAVVAYAQEQNRHRALADDVAENRRSLDLADGLYKNGRVNFLDVLDARRSLYQSDDQWP